MINTFHTSLPPPRVPPRLQSSRPRSDRNSSLVKFLSVVLLLLMILTFGGFFYLFSKTALLQGQLLQRSNSDMTILNRLLECEDEASRSESLLDCKTLLASYRNLVAKLSQDGKASMLSGQAFVHGPVAQITAKYTQSTSNVDQEVHESEMLQWDWEHSVLNGVSYSKNALIIQQPGFYYVHCQVTFSARNSKVPLKQVLWAKAHEKDLAVDMLEAFCSLHSDTKLLPDLCTSFMAGVVKLEQHQQLFVNVTDLRLVSKKSTTFGLFKL